MTRKIEREMQRALCDRRNWRKDNTEVAINEFGDSSLNFELAVWTEEMTATPIHFTSQMNFIIEKKLRDNDIEIPFPQRDLHVRSGLSQSMNEKKFS